MFRFWGFCFVLFCFLGPYPWQYGSSQARVESELQLLAYTTAIARQDLSRVFHLQQSSCQCWILDHRARPGIEPTSSRILGKFISTASQREIPMFSFMGQLDWATWLPRYLAKHHSECFFWMRLTFKSVDWVTQTSLCRVCVWGSSNQLKVWIEQNSWSSPE